MQKNPVVEVKNLRHYYRKGSGGDFLVLEDINMCLYEDEIVCLLGRSGSGKSTLLRCISGLITPSEGDLLMQKVPLTGPREGLAMVFQSFALYPWLTVLENVALGLEALHVSPEETRKRAFKAIDLIGISRRPPREQKLKSYSDLQKSLPVKLARLLPSITIGYCFDSHPRINSVFQKHGYRSGLLENAITVHFSATSTSFWFSRYFLAK